MKTLLILVIFYILLVLHKCLPINYKHKPKKKQAHNGHARDVINLLNSSSSHSNETIGKRFFGKQLGFSYDRDKESRENKPTVLKNLENSHQGVHTGYHDEENWDGNDETSRRHSKKSPKNDSLSDDEDKGEKLFGGERVDHNEHTKFSNSLMSKLGFTFHGGRVHMDEDGHLVQGDPNSKNNSLVGGRGGNYHRGDEDDDDDENDENDEKEDSEKSHKNSSKEDDEDEDVTTGHHIGPFPFAPLPQGYHKGRGPQNEPDDDEEDRIKDEKEEREEKALREKERQEEEEEEEESDRPAASHRKKKKEKNYSEADENPYHHQEHVSIAEEESDKETVGLPLKVNKKENSKKKGNEMDNNEDNKPITEDKKSSHNIVFVLNGKEGLEEIKNIKGFNDIIKTLTEKAKNSESNPVSALNKSFEVTNNTAVASAGSSKPIETKPNLPSPATQNISSTASLVKEVNQPTSVAASENRATNVLPVTEFVPTTSTSGNQVSLNNQNQNAQESRDKKFESPIQSNGGVLTSSTTGSFTRTDSPNNVIQLNQVPSSLTSETTSPPFTQGKYVNSNILKSNSPVQQEGGQVLFKSMHNDFSSGLNQIQSPGENNYAVSLGKSFNEFSKSGSLMNKNPGISLPAENSLPSSSETTYLTQNNNEVFKSRTSGEQASNKILSRNEASQTMDNDEKNEKLISNILYRIEEAKLKTQSQNENQNNQDTVKVVEMISKPMPLKESKGLTVSQIEEMKDDEHEIPSELPSRFRTHVRLPDPKETVTESFDSEKFNSGDLEFKEPSFQKVLVSERKKKKVLTKLISNDTENDENDKTPSSPISEERKALFRKVNNAIDHTFSKVSPETISSESAYNKIPIIETTKGVLKDTSNVPVLSYRHRSFYNEQNSNKEEQPTINVLNHDKFRLVNKSMASVLHCQKCETNPPNARAMLEKEPITFDLVFVKMNKP